MLTSEVLDALGDSDFQLDRPSPTVKYIHRRWKDADIYFLFNEGEERQDLNVTLAGTGVLQAWDAMTGQVADLPVEVAEKGYITTGLRLEPWETRFLVIVKK